MISRTKKLATEGTLIVFSVLFALFITQLVENNKVKKRKEQALTNIYIELSTNKQILNGWIHKHGRMKDILTKMVENPEDSLRQVLTKKQFLDFGVLTEEKSFIDALLNNTAWESAKSTQIIAEFEFKTVQDFTRVYALQRILQEESIRKFTNIYFERESQDLQNLSATLLQLQLVISEIVGQEETLKYLLDKLVNENWQKKNSL